MTRAERIDWTQPISFGDLCLSVEGWAARLDLTTGSLKNRIRDLGVEKALGTKRMSAAASGRRGGATWKRRYSTIASVS